VLLAREDVRRRARLVAHALRERGPEPDGRRGRGLERDGEQVDGRRIRDERDERRRRHDQLFRVLLHCGRPRARALSPEDLIARVEELKCEALTLY
jgi:hypothetical protein